MRTCRISGYRAFFCSGRSLASMLPPERACHHVVPTAEIHHPATRRRGAVACQPIHRPGLTGASGNVDMTCHLRKCSEVTPPAAAEWHFDGQRECVTAAPL